MLFQSSAPSQAPRMVTIDNNIGHTRFDVSWKHVPAKYLNGELTGYKLRLSLVNIGGEPVLNGKNEEKFIHPLMNKIRLSGLEPNARYSITLLASNKVGDGVSSSPVIGGKLNSCEKCKMQVCRLVNAGLQIGKTQVSG